jgi:hypothetical protein
MATLRIATAAFSALIGFSAPALAADPMTDDPVKSLGVSGHIEAYLGGVKIDAGFGDDSFFSYGGAARLNFPVNDRWNVQGEVTTDWISQGGDRLGSYGGVLHGYWRNPSSYAFGAFAAYEAYSFSFGGPAPDIRSWSVGPEAQVYFDNVTLYGQAYYGQISSAGMGNEITRWGLRGVARYFFTPNLMASAELGYGKLDFSGDSLTTLTLAAQGNYRFDNSPVSLFGRYQFEHLSADGTSSTANVHKLVAGVRLSFGSTTLLEEDRYGATMDTARPNFPLPFF